MKEGGTILRFEDSRDGWQRQLNELITNSNVRSFLRAMSKAEPVLIQNMNASVDDTSDCMCHQLVKDKIDAVTSKPIALQSSFQSNHCS